jgi:hypothetical protein
MEDIIMKNQQQSTEFGKVVSRIEPFPYLLAGSIYVGFKGENCHKNQPYCK